MDALAGPGPHAADRAGGAAGEGCVLVIKLLSPNMIRNGLSLYLIQFANFMLPLLALPYLTRQLGMAAFGVFSVMSAYLQYAAIITDYGFSLSATRYVSVNRESPQKISLAFSAILIIKLFLSLISLLAILVVIYISDFLVDFRTPFAFISLATWIFGLALFPLWLFQGFETTVVPSVINFAFKLSILVCLFLFITPGSSPVSVVFVYGVLYFVSGFFGMISAMRRFKLKLLIVKYTDLHLFIVEGWSIFVSSFFSNVLTGSGIIIASAFLPKEVVGGYSVIDKLAKAANSLLQPYSQAIFPRIAKSFSKSYSRGLLEVKKFGLPFVGIGVAVCLLFIFFGPDVTEIIFGKGYEGFDAGLSIFGVWLFFGVLCNILGIQIMVNLGKTSRYAVMFFISGALSTGLNIIFINTLGYISIPSSLLIGEMLLCTMSLQWFLKYSKEMGIHESRVL